MSENIKCHTKRRYLLRLDNDSRKKTEITHDFFLVGSNTDANLKLETEGIMDNHALIRLSGDCCYIMLLHPDAPVYINKEKLQPGEMSALRSQDSVVFSGVGFRYIEQV